MSLLPQKIAFLDIETTGVSLFNDRVIEIGVVRVENNQIVQKFQTLVNPQKHLPPEITMLTGINAAQLENAPTFREVSADLLDILKDCVMVAHNVRFDYSFLKTEFKRLEKEFNPKQFCTVKLSRSLFPQHRHHNLDSVMERLNISCKNRHRAFDDAFVLWEFYQKILKQFDEQVIFNAISQTLKRPTVPLRIALPVLDSLPETPGVYIFYGEKGMPLYVGKSVNIKRRVLSHFSSDHSSSTELKIAQQVERIETITTFGEMGALFKESELVKQLQPLYNRKLRRQQQMLVLTREETKDGYATVGLQAATQIAIDQVSKVINIFKSKKQVKEYLIYLAKEYSLCEQLLNLEKSSSGCFGYRLGRCQGACVQKEDIQTYNQRFNLAFSERAIDPWPYSGPILIKEEDPWQKSGQAYIFDKWVYLGSLNYTEYDQSPKLESDVSFDLDTYKILRQFLQKKTKIKVLDKLNFYQLGFGDYSNSFN